MSESYTPTDTPVYPTGQFDPPDSNGTNDADVKSVAKDQAAGIGQGAAEAGQHVASVAKDQAKEVTTEAKQQATQLLQQAQSQASEQASAQQQKLASGLKSLSDELHSMAQNGEQQGLASDLAREAAVRTGGVADWLGSREPGAVLDEVTSFARRSPGTFLAVAAGVGFLAGRLTRGLKTQSSDSGTASASGTTSPAIADGYSTAPTPYPMSQSGYASGPPQTASMPEVNLNDPTLAPITPVTSGGQVAP